LTGSDIFNAAKGLGIRLRSRGVRTGPLTPRQLRQLGLRDLAKELSAAAQRPVHFMIYQSSDAATARSSSIPAASESEISATRPPVPTPPEGEPAKGVGGAERVGGAEGAAGVGDVLGVAGWILLFIDAQEHGGVFSPGGCQVLAIDPSICPAPPGAGGSI